MTIESVMALLGGADRKEWQLFERLVAGLHGTAGGDVSTTWNENIDGRQFDVTLRFKRGIHDYLTVIECKNYSTPVPVEKVDAFVTKARSVNANKAVLASSSGFQSGAIKVAKDNGIKLLTLEESFENPAPFKVAGRIPGISLHSFRVARADGHPDISIDETTGKLEYVVRHSTIRSGTEEFTFEEWMSRNVPNLRISVPPHEESLQIEFPPGAMWLVPHEDPVPIRSIYFKRAPTEFLIPAEKGIPVIDRWLLERQGLRIKVTDESGNVLDLRRLNEIAFDFDTTLREGDFYWSPSLGFYYYLDKIEGDLLTWMLVESYQHGNLLQVVFKQEHRNAKGFVTVTSPATLKRLRRLLEAMKSTQSAR